MTAAEPIPDYLRGWVDGAAGRMLGSDVTTGAELYNLSDIIEAYLLGRRRTPLTDRGVDAETVDLAERISRQLLAQVPGPGPRRRHLRLVEAPPPDA